MAQECGFFNARLEGGEYDRVYNAEQFAAYFASFVGNGIFGDSMSELVVTENNTPNMSVNVETGQAWINGWWYRNTDTYNLSIDVADGVLNRIDTIVLRWGNEERDMWLQVIKGTPSANPSAPAIIRNADYYDLKLCQISIPAGTVNIRQSQITDTRPDTSVCGFVTGLIDQIDFNDLYLQLTNSFEVWFDHMKDQLDSDAAGHLQGEIDEINENAYLVSDEASTTIDDTDYIPMSGPGSNKKKTLFSTLKEKLLGNTDISSIGATVTAAISSLYNTISTSLNHLSMSNDTIRLQLDSETHVNIWKKVNNVWGTVRRVLMTTDVINTLDSTETQLPLSANQGRLLNNTKLTKTGDTMTGALGIAANLPLLAYRRYLNGVDIRKLETYIDPNNNVFYVSDYINGTYVGHPFGIEAADRTFWTEYNFLTGGGIRNNAGWMDWYYNGVHRMALFCNNNDRADVWYSPAGDRLEMRTTGGIEIKTNVSCSVGTMDWTRGVPLRAGSFEQFSSRLIKENIQPMTDEDGYKVLDLNPVHFDFKEKFGGEKNNIGLIAEETLDIIPEIVNVPDNYDESEFDEDKGLNNKLLAVDYVKLTPYLVKLCQMQQKEIDELRYRIEKLESKR